MYHFVLFAYTANTNEYQYLTRYCIYLRFGKDFSIAFFEVLAIHCYQQRAREFLGITFALDAIS